MFTTVNVQHLEGLNDKIAAITHVSVAERIPDRIFDQAASVELVDIEPDDLIERLEAGKIYLPDRARTALGNFFSRKNLAALREIALRRMADRLTRKAECTEAGARVEAGEDVLVYVTHNTGQRESHPGRCEYGGVLPVGRSLRWWSSRRRARSSIPTSADDCAPTSIWPKSWVRT